MTLEFRSCSKLKETNEQIELAIDNHTQAWKYIFECFEINVNNKQSINLNNLISHDSKITK